MDEARHTARFYDNVAETTNMFILAGLSSNVSVFLGRIPNHRITLALLYSRRKSSPSSILNRITCTHCSLLVHTTGLLSGIGRIMVAGRHFPGNRSLSITIISFAEPHSFSPGLNVSSMHRFCNRRSFLPLRSYAKV